MEGNLGTSSGSAPNQLFSGMDSPWSDVDELVTSMDLLHTGFQEPGSVLLAS
jgi:hypothetical protein